MATVASKGSNYEVEKSSMNNEAEASKVIARLRQRGVAIRPGGDGIKLVGTVTRAEISEVQRLAGPIMQAIAGAIYPCGEITVGGRIVEDDSQLPRQAEFEQLGEIAAPEYSMPLMATAPTREQRQEHWLTTIVAHLRSYEWHGQRWSDEQIAQVLAELDARLHRDAVIARVRVSHLRVVIDLRPGGDMEIHRGID
jgi:hypothetical protein